MAELVDQLPACPVCGANATRVVEDVSDEVTILGCDDCSQTWALRAD